jgi:hypothetical protein
MSKLNRRLALGACATLVVTLLPAQGLAHNPQDFGQYVRGATMGDPVGAAPPPGLYFENTTLFAPEIVGNGQVRGLRVDALVDIPLLVWSPGWSFFGASYLAYVAQPAFNLTAWFSTASGAPNAPAQFFPTLHNTYVNPVGLSWNLGGGLFASAGFGAFIPDGSRYNLTANPDYWTFEPHGAVSYLAGGWDLTAHFLYDFNTASAGHSSPFAGTPAAAFGMGYRSGDQAFLDLTATKKYGKWEIGPVAYFEWQTTPDQPGSGFTCAQMQAVTTVACGRATDYAIGGLIGYDWGPVALKMIMTETFFHADELGGFALWTKISFPLSGTDAPASKPVTAKRPLITK